MKVALRCDLFEKGQVYSYQLRARALGRGTNTIEECRMDPTAFGYFI